PSRRKRTKSFRTGFPFPGNPVSIYQISFFGRHRKNRGEAAPFSTYGKGQAKIGDFMLFLLSKFPSSYLSSISISLHTILP
ncbi:hypothetical protein, partial [uncultured Akkermansia sp.]|uniref:hypothetical protein n=1 Tax=uncultured Akkermansia sp. TaxID=512294 RepID=UPI00265D1834